ECLVDEVLQHVFAPDIKDERYSRPKRGDITKILLRADTKIDSARLRRFFRLGDEGGKLAFIGHVLEPKGAGFFGEVGHHPPEGGIRDLGGKSIRRFKR